MDRIHIGTMGWSYPFWVENFYPKGAKSSEYLTEYSKHFDTVEIDSTFYRIPSKISFEKWRDQTPVGFLFSAKFPQIITHNKMLKRLRERVRILHRKNLYAAKQARAIVASVSTNVWT